MQQFQVPQFIDVEDKIIGPLTLKQFLFFVGAGIITFFIKTFLSTGIAMAIGIPLFAFAAVLGFLKINGRPFYLVIVSAFKYYSAGKIYIWRMVKKKKKEEQIVKKEKGEAVTKLTESKLKELSWSLDVHEKLKR